jgi:hypothetical protein
MSQTQTLHSAESLSLRIVQIKTTAFKLSEWYVVEDENKPVNLELQHKIGYLPAHNIVVLTVRCYAHYEDEALKDQLLLEIEVENQFFIEGLERFITDGTDNLPVQAWITMIALSIGHVRALLAEKVRGTRLGNIMLPILDPVEVTKTYMPHRFSPTITST